MTPSADSAFGSKALFSRGTVLLYVATLLAYANIAVFFQYVAYLHSLPIDPRWTGLLIGSFSAVSLVLRPVVSPFFHAGSTPRYLIGGTALLVAALLGYRVADTLATMLAVRILHGLAFVVLGTALLFLMVERIPKQRSAQAFGLLAIVVLIPNTLIPPVLPVLVRLLGGFTNVLTAFAAASLLVLPLALAGGRDGSRSAGPAPRHPLKAAEILCNLKDLRVVLSLGAMLLLYSGYAMVFFFIDGYGRVIGVAHRGFFLTLATAGEIGVRLAAGHLFDRLNKRLLAGWTLAAMSLGYVLLANVSGKGAFFGLGLLLGVAWGVSMPVFNGLLFDISAVRLRAFNVNLGMQMFQGGFFVGPFIGAAVAGSWGFSAVFYVCAVFGLLAAALCFYMDPAVNESVLKPEAPER